MADYAGVLADLKKRLSAVDLERAALDAEREELVELVARVERLMARTARVAKHSEDPPKMSGLTMPKAIEAYFSSQFAAQPYTTKQVQQGVTAGGFKGKMKNIRGHVYNTLDRLSKDNGPIRKHADGRWSWRAWNLPVGEANTKTGLDFQP